jgi:hypothetical protein
VIIRAATRRVIGFRLPQGSSGAFADWLVLTAKMTPSKSVAQSLGPDLLAGHRCCSNAAAKVERAPLDVAREGIDMAEHSAYKLVSGR